MTGGADGVVELVIDASIGVKWFVPETQSEVALRLLGPGFRCTVPTLFYTEVAQTLWKKVYQRRTMSLEDGREGLQSLQVMPLIVHSANSLLDSAFLIATKTGRTVYDSIYLALAESLGYRLVTADLRLFNGLQGDPLSALLLKLDDVPGSIDDQMASPSIGNPLQ